MKKFYLFLVLGLVLTSSVFAQKQGISIGGNVYFPVGDFAEAASIGYGGSASYEHLLGKNIAGVLYSGYTVFDSEYEGGGNWTIIPLLVGAKFYFNPKLDWYVAALIGVDFVSLDGTTEYTETAYTGSSTEFAGNLNFGYELKTSEKGAVDISAGFVYIDQFSYFGMRLAYIFKF
jgi:hypothetical protein